MRLFLLCSLTLTAFALNSIANRWAVGRGLIAPLTFAVLRLVAGAVALTLVLAERHVRSGQRVTRATLSVRPVGTLALLTYLFGFSAAYGALDAGSGALILFGTVQLTMFVGAHLRGEATPWRRRVGGALAFAGLLVLVAPGAHHVAPTAAGAMAVAGVGWGVYSLAGRGERDPLAATAANFVWAVPLAVALVALTGTPTPPVVPTTLGVSLALLSGSLTSGLGYALWYRVLPELGAGRAAVAQLTVPLLAAGGSVALGEPPSLRFMFAAAPLLGGVALACMAPARDAQRLDLSRR